jgi:transposase
MKRRKLITESEKNSIIEEYITTEVSSRKLAARYGINNSTILLWVKGKNTIMESKKLKRSKTESESKVSVSTDYQLEIKRLKKELEKVELEKELYKEIIKLAEADLGFSLKKNLDTKL